MSDILGRPFVVSPPSVLISSLEFLVAEALCTEHAWIIRSEGNGWQGEGKGERGSQDK